MKKLLYLIFIITVLIFVQSSVLAKPAKFVQVTDVHLTKYNASYLKNFVNDVNSKYDDIDFVVFTGDNIDRANIDDLKLFLKTIKELKFKTYVLVGNHDVAKYQNLDKKLYMSTVKQELGPYHRDKTNYVFKDNGIVFVVMDGVKEVMPGAGGYFKQNELKWLDKNLNKYKNEKVVILQHFPLLDAKKKSSDLYDKEDYKDVLSKHSNVLAIISGHYHENREEYKDNIYNIVTMKFLNNTYYKIIEIDSVNGMVYTQLIDNSCNPDGI